MYELVVIPILNRTAMHALESAKSRAQLDLSTDDEHKDLDMLRLFMPNEHDAKQMIMNTLRRVRDVETLSSSMVSESIQC